MRPAMRKGISRSVRSRVPLMAEFAMLRHVRRDGALSELIYELGSVPRDRRRLREVRAGRDVCWLEPPTETDPLVTVRIATKDRPDTLTGRALPSALAQTYSNLEILIVGDHCDDRTADALAAFDDPRIRYVNLGRQGDYPADPVRRWQVAGSKPMNAALALAAGDWIAPMDDDDQLTDDHVESMLRFAQERRLEFAWSRAEQLGGPNSDPIYIGHPILSPACTTHGAVFYSMGLSIIPYSATCDRLDEPFDWNMWKRFQLAGAKMAYLDHVTYRTWPGGSEQYAEPTP